MKFNLGIVFAFLLSLTAAGGSYYLYQSWVEERTVRGSFEAKYDQAKEKIVTVQSEKEQLQAKAEAMQEQLGTLQAEQARIDAEKTKLETQLKSHQSMIAELQKQVGELAQKAKDAQAACGVTPSDLRTDLLESPKPFDSGTSSLAPSPGANSEEIGTSPLVFKPMTPGESGGSGATTTQSSVSAVPAQDMSRVPSVTEVPVESTTSLPETSPEAPEASSAPVPGVSGATSGGKVLTVNRKFNFVVINQGLQDGLKMGDKLKVLKGGQESATIQVEKLYDKFSAATLVEEDPNRQVVEGDEIRKI